MSAVTPQPTVGGHAPRRPRAPQRPAQRLSAACPGCPALARLETALDTLAARLTHVHTPALLVGHAAIGRYCRKAPDTIRGYVRSMGFPAHRWGRHVVSSSPAMIDGWLIAMAQRKRDAKARRSRRRLAVYGEGPRALISKLAKSQRFVGRLRRRRPCYTELRYPIT